MGGEHIIQYTDGVLQNCTSETYIILLTNVTSLNAIKKEKSRFTVVCEAQNLFLYYYL